MAAENGQLKIVKVLLEMGADPYFINKKQLYHGATDTSILIAAAMGNNPEIVQLIIDRGVDLNHADGYGDPAINWAAHHGKIDVIDVLIKAGCDMNMIGYNNFTALDHAKNQGFPEAEKILKQASALSSAHIH